MKRLYLTLLTMLIFVVSAQAQSFEADGISYCVTKQPDGESPGEVEVTTSISKGTDELGDESGGYEGDIIIPAEVMYDGKAYEVTSIGWYSFRNCPSLSSITIPNSVTKICYGAFVRCTGLTSITIPNNVTEIGDFAFASCTDLTSVTIPNSVITIGESVFNGCKKLTSVILSDQLTTIEKGAFGYCTSLESITIPNSVTKICNDAFSVCSKLTSVILSDQLTTIEFCAFQYCTSLESITIPNSVKKIGQSTFYNCSKLTSIILSDQLTNIESQTFSGCTSLESITVPNSVTKIGANAFNDCSNLTSVILGNQLKTIESSAFYRCTSLESITIPNSVKEIGGHAFQDCNKLTSVILSEQLTTIEDATFDWCTSLESITIPNSVTTIGEYAFRKCEKLTSVTLSNQLTTIGSNAFALCTSLTSITIPNSVTSIGDNAFWGCDNLMMITSEITTPFDIDAFSSFDATLVIPNGSRTAYNNVSGWNFALILEKDETGYEREKTDEQGVCYSLRQADDNSLYYSVTGHSDELKAEIVIPADLDGYPVRTIECLDAVGAFDGCSNLTSVKILGNQLTTIGERAFNGCTNLTSFKMGKNVSNIGEYAFNNCSSLTSITLPNMLENIGAGAFYSTGLTSVSIPGNVKTIGSGAFNGCSDLASVSFEEGMTSIGNNAFRACALTSITIPNSVERIGSYAFSDNNSLTNVILGDGITEIEDGTFQGCGALSSVIIPDGVTHIGDYAFWNCSLASVKLPESLTSMGDRALSGSMKSIELPNSFTVIPEGLFSGNDFQYIKLGNNVKSIGKNAFGSRGEPVIEISTSTPPSLDKDAFPNVEYLSDFTVIVPDAKAETAYGKAAVWEEMTFANQDNICEVTVETPGELSKALISQCRMMPAKVVGLKVNGTINDNDFKVQMLTNMKSLLRLDLSDCDITEIPDEAMKGKTQLQELTLPTRLQSIGKNAFQGCPYLTGELDLPSTVTSIGESAFVGTAYTSVKMPSALKAIGDYAFNNLPIKQKLTLPGKVTSVGAYAFAGTQINGLVIPDGVKSIGDYAFAETPIQGHVTIPDGITSLGAGAFRNTQISTVFLPNSIATLSEGLFQGCQSLNTVYVPDNYTDLAGYAFDGCSALTTLRLSANLTSMEGYALQNTPLEYIRIPSQVEVLSGGVLKNCKNLESLTLPASLKSVEGEALYGCTALRNLSVEALTPPTIKNKSSIRGINTDKCLISIPTDAYWDYVLAEYWGQFVQMRNDIAVETAGNGEIAFESVEEEEEEVSESRRRSAAARSVTRAQLATDEESMTFANNGSSVYVPQQGKVRFYIIPGEGEELLSATLDGEDIMPDIVDGVYTATADKVTAKLVVKFSGTGQGSVLLGDVDGDGTIDVADIVAMINAILGKPSSDYHADAADINDDKEVDVFDVTKAINLLFSQNNAARLLARATGIAEEQAYITTTASGVTLGINDADRFTAFQFDVEVADGVELLDACLTADITNHLLRFVKTGQDTYKVVGLSLDNSTFSASGNDLVELLLSKDGDVHISNIVFVTPQETKVYFISREAVVTGIDGTVSEQKSEEVFDLSGRKVNTDRSRLPKGVYIINNKKVVIK